MSTSKIFILLIEDNEAEARFVKEVLRGVPGIEINTVDRLALGIGYLTSHPTDIVLLDLGLPDSQGMDSLNAIIRANPDVTVIVVTGLEDETLAKQAIQHGAQDYIVKPIMTGPVFLRMLRFAHERKKAETALKKSETKYRRLHESMRDGFVYVDMHGAIHDCNESYQKILGYTFEELTQMRYVDLTPEKWHAYEQGIVNEQIIPRGYSEVYEKEYRRKDGTVLPVELRTFLIMKDSGEHEGMWAIVRDIKNRKELEARNHLARGILELLNRSVSSADIVYDILQLVKKDTGFEAIGIRLKEGDDFPYYQTSGFPDNFVQAERYLCARDEEGMIIRDEQGNPVLECMCGNILCGRTNPALPFFTEGGSFWSNCTSELLAATTEENRQARTRNRCNGEGYESLALIPLRSGNQIIGLLQLNDRRPDMFTLEMIKFFEGLGASIGIALSHRQTEMALHNSEKRYRRLFESARDGILILDAETGQVVDVNPYLLELLSYSYDELWGKYIWDIGQFKDIASSKVAFKTLQDQEYIRYEDLPLETNDGRHIQMEFVSNVYMVDGLKVIQCNIRDITERKKAEAALVKEHKELEAALAYVKKAQAQVIQQEKMASIGQIAAGIAHEINNPMSFITGNLDILQTYIDGITETIKMQDEIIKAHAPPEALEALEALVAMRKKRKIDHILKDIGHIIGQSLDGADRVKRIVADLKSFSRMEEDAYMIEDINTALDSTINIVSNEIKYKAGLVKEFGELPLTLCNISHLNQVFMNLLVNAAQAIEKWGKITVRTWKKENDIYVSIADTGSGIPEDNLKEIFEPFFTTKEKGKGTGLGLSISYDIVRKHSGEITVKSKFGEGTTFTVRIPIVTS